MLELESIHHHFAATKVLNGINLTVAAGEIVCLLGASGSGKSTLLRVVAGLEPLQDGVIRFNRRTLAQPGAEPPAEARNFGLVFQDHVLFPHMTIAENVGFGLHSLAADERAQRVQQQLNSVGLAAYGERYPHTLSGGQQQRVALARALAPRPGLMLLDEPFASVDSTLRRRLREDTRRALRAANVPAIVVTHDAQEAMELADRIAVIGAGSIVQTGTPQQVWQQPVDRFVAELFADTDAIRGEAGSDAVITAFGPVPLPAAPAPAGTPCEVIVRRRAVHLQPAADTGITVEDIRFLGERYLIILRAGGQHLRADTANPPPLQPGDSVAVNFDYGDILVYFADHQ